MTDDSPSAGTGGGPRTWTFRHRVVVSCARPEAEWYSNRPQLRAASVDRAGRILVPEGTTRLTGKDRIEWSGEVETVRMYAPYNRDAGAPAAAALDFGVSCLRFALASIWRWNREQNLPGRVEAKVRQVSVTEGRVQATAPASPPTSGETEDAT